MVICKLQAAIFEPEIHSACRRSRCRGHSELIDPFFVFVDEHTCRYLTSKHISDQASLAGEKLDSLSLGALECGVSSAKRPHIASKKSSLHTFYLVEIVQGPLEEFRVQH